MSAQDELPAPNACTKPRRLTVGYKPLKSPGAEVPCLRLHGRWLRDAGFEVGRSVKVEVHKGCLTIEPVD
jgi:toxic protein SymE